MAVEGGVPPSLSRPPSAPAPDLTPAAPAPLRLLQPNVPALAPVLVREAVSAGLLMRTPMPSTLLWSTRALYGVESPVEVLPPTGIAAD